MFSHQRQSLNQIYSQLEAQIREFQDKSHLSCVKGCGRCCLNPEIETTVLEMIPAALVITENGQTEAVLNRIEDSFNKGPCILFEPNPFGKGAGRCGDYESRPLICRLFGFSAAKDKHGKPQLVTCKTIKETSAGEYERSVEQIKNGLPVPLMSDFAQQVANIDPGVGREQLPINLALKRALEKVGLHKNLNQDND